MEAFCAARHVRDRPARSTPCPHTLDSSRPLRSWECVVALEYAHIDPGCRRSCRDTHTRDDRQRVCQVTAVICGANTDHEAPPAGRLPCDTAPRVHPAARGSGLTVYLIGPASHIPCISYKLRHSSLHSIRARCTVENHWIDISASAQSFEIGVQISIAKRVRVFHRINQNDTSKPFRMSLIASSFEDHDLHHCSDRNFLGSKRQPPDR